MKISLIGDFSTVHANLKKGFLSNRVQCDVYSDGDSFKNTSRDFYYGNPYSGYFGLTRYLMIDQLKQLRSIFESSDVVQFMGPNSIVSPNHFRIKYASQILKIFDEYPNVKVGFLICGCDAHVEKKMRMLPRSPCEGCLKDDGLGKCGLNDTSRLEYENIILDRADLIQPLGGSSYFNAYKSAAPSLPFPFDSDLPFICQGPVEKLRVLHGINRRGFKGSEIILEVLRDLEICYPDLFEVVVPERLPYDKYIELVGSCDIVVDQLFGDGLGMNALACLSMGKVVLTSHDRDWVSKLYGSDSPAFDVFSSESLRSTLLKIAEWDIADFRGAGEKSRKFVENSCSSEIISKKILDRYFEKQT